VAEAQAADSSPGSWRNGWGAVLAAFAARTYLLLLAALATVSLLPALFGWSASVVQSGSMEPNISAGDVVITSPLPESHPLPVGRVVTFRIDGMLVVHRIVEVSDDGTLVTAGDANPALDPWSPRRSDVTGQARLLVPYVGLPALWTARGHFVQLAIWGTATLAALLLVVVTSRGGRRARRDGDRRRRSAGARRRNRAVRVAAATVLILVLPTTYPVRAEAAFSGRTLTNSSFTAKSYSPISVGSMAGYGIIAYASVRDDSGSTSNSTVTGAIATTPGRTVLNYASRDVTGGIHLADQGAVNAMASAGAARTALAQQEVTSTRTPFLSGTLPGGVYTSTTGAFSVPGSLTLDGRGDSSARFVFRATGGLSMSQGATIVLINGAQAANVWWVVESAAVIGGTNLNTAAIGNYLVNGDAILRRTTLTGRIVSFTGTVSSDASSVRPPN
jgi:signal peptidase I